MKDFDFDKLDKLWIGALLGLIFPFIAYFLYYSFVNSHNLKTVNISLCMVVELVPFYLTLNKELYKATKGVLISTVLLALLIGYLSFFTNFFHIL